MRINSNKGFSLIELIVVIAIMAVLVGLLAPAYLKYVEKSRKTSDIQGIGQIMDAAEAVSTDEEYHVPKGAIFLIDAHSGVVDLKVPEEEWQSSAVADEEKDYYEPARIEWISTANNGDPYDLKSREWNRESGQLQGLVVSDGSIRWTVVSSTGVFESMAGFSKHFADKLNR